MGLDQYAFVEVSGTDDAQIAYWRKHNRLHGWMENLYNKKAEAGLVDKVDCFNCVNLPLTLEDLDQLEKDIDQRNLPKTTGSFFGSDSYDGMYVGRDENYLQFIKTARVIIKEGNKVYYTSWW